MSVMRRSRGQLARDLLQQPRIFGGDDSRVSVAATAKINNTLFNVTSGTVTVGEWAMLAHNVALLTGTHDATKFGRERQDAYPTSGRDIVVEEGAWLASNVTVLGPCRIGRHAVVAAGSLVQHDIEPFAIVAGVPARIVGSVDPDGAASAPGGDTDNGDRGNIGGP
jgi:acetyltransferase-like isoleucine patch superfamily enzyme